MKMREVVAAAALLIFLLVAVYQANAAPNAWRVAAGETFQAQKMLNERGHDVPRPYVLTMKHPACLRLGAAGCAYSHEEGVYFIEYALREMREARVGGKTSCAFRHLAYHELFHVENDSGSQAISEGRADWLATVYTQQDREKGLCHHDRPIFRYLERIEDAKALYGNWHEAKRAQIGEVSG